MSEASSGGNCALSELDQESLVKILTEPRNALTRQYAALLETEGLEVEFTDDALEELATLAEDAIQKSKYPLSSSIYTLNSTTRPMQATPLAPR